MSDKKITITVNRNLLGQVLEAAQVRTELMEGDIEAGGFDSEDIQDMQETVVFTRKAIQHIYDAIDAK